ncbi:MAG: SPASM domain-containing protein [Bryobacterales bacterium]|nr:SPASM domain-containing protein [Bryobacterales bacterium]
MESIYYVLSWLCHRKCEHCYEERFHPYHGDELRQVQEQSVLAMPEIVANFPDRLTYLDSHDGFREKIGRVILSGGEVLLDPIREPVLYPAIARLKAKYAGQGGVRIIIQTTGDVLNERILAELLDQGVWLISISGMDAYHEGFEEEAARQRLISKLTNWFNHAGMRECASASSAWHDPDAAGPYYHFFGATPESWIGKLWPRGRAWNHELSQAGITDNFCNQWSGGVGFLSTRHRGSEVSVDPEGNVYPCCIKTRRPIGNLRERSLDQILASLQGHPVYEAISMGHPERMGVTYGWSVEKFFEKSRVVLPSGRDYQNMCIGCDRFHDEVLAPHPNLVQVSL